MLILSMFNHLVCCSDHSTIYGFYTLQSFKYYLPLGPAIHPYCLTGLIIYSDNDFVLINVNTVISWHVCSQL
jgi:hypothetical protein